MRTIGSVGEETAKSTRKNAVALIAKYGYEAMSLRLLAERVGLQPGSLYNHISRKQALLHWRGVFAVPRSKTTAYSLIAALTGIALWYKPSGELDRLEIIRLYTDFVLRMTGCEQTQRALPGHLWVCSVADLAGTALAPCVARTIAVEQVVQNLIKRKLLASRRGANPCSVRSPHLGTEFATLTGKFPGKCFRKFRGAKHTPAQV